MAQIVENTPSISPLIIRVGNRVQIKVAADAAAKMAGAIGFAPRECAEVALAVSELTSNLLRHAGSGEIQLSSLQEQRRAGIQIMSRDSGPGIADVERALADGFSTAGGPGNGLGAVNRLMDSLEFYPCQPSGLRVVCQRWVRPDMTGFSAGRLVFGAATRSCRLDPKNGDALVIRQWPDNGLAGVIDGLGHGQFAQRAAQTARHYVESHFDQPLASIFRGVGRVCLATRGVVMALAHFDLARKRVVVATLGNIEVRLLGDEKVQYPLVRRGIVGQPSAPDPILSEHPWTDASVLIMHSDGIRSAWEHEQRNELWRLVAAGIAQELLQRYGRPDDDATVVVVKSQSA